MPHESYSKGGGFLRKGTVRGVGASGKLQYGRDSPGGWRVDVSGKVQQDTGGGGAFLWGVPGKLQ